MKAAPSTVNNGADKNSVVINRLVASVATVAVAALLLLGFSTAVQANASPVVVIGLFKDRALLRLPNKQELLVRVGETKSGATLLSANAQGARVSYQGTTYKLGLAQSSQTGYAASKRNRVAVPLDPRGQYRVMGSINRENVSFLVDTGASMVAISSDTADELGINYRAGRVGRVQTAQGETPSYFVELPEVQVGDIKVQDVRTAVITGAYPRDVLLGMSFLREVQMREDNGTLMLTQK